MQMGLVTVIMPVYNGITWLEESVNSILRQTYRHFEFIIVDDGSTDGSREYLQTICDERVRLHFFSENKGIVEALNYGLQIAQGEFIARMDQDDISVINRFEEQLIFFNAHSEVILVCGKIKAFSREETVKSVELTYFEETYNRGITNEEITKLLLQGNCINHPSVMFRRKVLDHVGFYNKEMEYAEDYDLFVRMSRVGRLAKIDKVLHLYRVHPKQMSKYLPPKIIADAKIKANYIKESYLGVTKKVHLVGDNEHGKLVFNELVKLGVSLDVTNKWEFSIQFDSLWNKVNDFIILVTCDNVEKIIEKLILQGWQEGNHWILI